VGITLRNHSGRFGVIAATVTLTASGLFAVTAGSAAAHPTALPVAARSTATPNALAPDRMAASTPSRTTASTNPLARPWSLYEGDAEQSWPPYDSSTGRRHDQLATIALRPKAKWFGAWIPDNDIATKVTDYIQNALANASSPDALVQMTIFRVVPWETDASTRLPAEKEVRSYKTWIDNFAGAIGSTHTAIVLQPDGLFANQAPHHSLALSHLVRYAAQELSALPNTSVYIEEGSGDWTRGKIAPAMQALTNGGISYARGFALNGTHYDSTASEIKFGTRIVTALARQGYGTKYFVVDTAENGKPFTGKYWHAHPSGTDFNNAAVCRTKAQTHCVTLGIPPTWHVAAARWHLPATARRDARKYVDAYLWFGRPWLTNQSDPFQWNRALPMCRTTPYSFTPRLVG
jgi:endoglucanase